MITKKIVRPLIFIIILMPNQITLADFMEGPNIRSYTINKLVEDAKAKLSGKVSYVVLPKEKWFEITGSKDTTKLQQIFNGEVFSLPGLNMLTILSMWSIFLITVKNT